MKRGYVLMILGSILIVASVLIMVPSILFIYSTISSISIDGVVRIAIETILGRLGMSPDSPASDSRVAIALSVVGIVVSPILIVDGIIALIAGGILLLVDRRKEQGSAALHRP